MALKLKPTPGEIVLDRIRPTVLSVAFLALDIGLLALIRQLQNVALEVPVALAVAYGAWSMVSWAWTGERFELKVVLTARSTRELTDTLCTAFFAVNSAVFLYAVLSP